MNFYYKESKSKEKKFWRGGGGVARGKRFFLAKNPKLNFFFWGGGRVREWG